VVVDKVKREPPVGRVFERSEIDARLLRGESRLRIKFRPQLRRDLTVPRARIKMSVELHSGSNFDRLYSMSRKLLTLLVFGLPLGVVLLAVSASGFLLVAGESPNIEARLLRGWCGFLMILMTADVLLLVTLLGWQRLIELSQDHDPELELSSHRYRDEIEIPRE
jgi:hypothetical protein